MNGSKSEWVPCDPSVTDIKGVCEPFLLKNNLILRPPSFLLSLPFSPTFTLLYHTLILLLFFTPLHFYSATHPFSNLAFSSSHSPVPPAKTVPFLFLKKSTQHRHDHGSVTLFFQFFLLLLHFQLLAS
jgi:hypothetical protein